MKLKRAARHLLMTHWQVNRVFSRKALVAIEVGITASEAAHAGEIRFVIEGALDSTALLKGQSARERAIEVFSQLRIWDTEGNNGVLIYLLLADRDVEIVADRGIHAMVGTMAWENICRQMEAAFRAADYQVGVLAGIEAVTLHLTKHCPATGMRRNELPDRAMLL